MEASLGIEAKADAEARGAQLATFTMGRRMASFGLNTNFLNKCPRGLVAGWDGRRHLGNLEVGDGGTMDLHRLAEEASQTTPQEIKIIFACIPARYGMTFRIPCWAT